MAKYNNSSILFSRCHPPKFDGIYKINNELLNELITYKNNFNNKSLYIG